MNGAVGGSADAFTTKDRVHRHGATVHRPMSWWSPAVHDLLRYLEEIDFPYSPRLLDVTEDENGPVEILSRLDGESGPSCLTRLADPAVLASFARLLREYHQAVGGYRPPADAVWALATGRPEPGEVLCHGDFGPWNVVWHDDEPVGIIDWDTVLPAPPSYDVCFAMEYVVPFRDDDWAIRYHGFDAAPDRPTRIRLFLDAYGIEIPDVVDAVAAVQWAGLDQVEQLAARGSLRQQQWIADGYLAQIADRARWTENHRSLLE